MRRRNLKVSSTRRSERLEARTMLSVSAGFDSETRFDELGASVLHDSAALASDQPYVADEVVVALRAGGEPADLAAYLSEQAWPLYFETTVFAGAEHVATVGNALGESLSIITLPLPGGTDVMAAAADITALTHVAWAAPNFIYQEEAEFTPNDPLFNQQYHHPLMQNNDAWDITLGSPDIIVAVTDTGFDWTHTDLAAGIWNNTGEIAGNGIDDDGNGFIDDIRGWDFKSNDNNPAESGGSTHGTHVAGIVAARTNNGTGVAGTAGGVTIMPLRISGSPTSSIYLGAFTYAANNGANIVNTSFNVDSKANDATYKAGLDAMYGAGILHFNSAGNNNQLNPARQSLTQSILVANTNSSDQKSGSSNYGDGIDVSAPGSSIRSTLPGNAYGLKSGTSMASPNAAGVAALIWSLNPGYTRDQVAAQLLATADNIDAMNSGFKGGLGSGRVNSFRALTETIPPPTIEKIDGLPGGGSTVFGAPTGFRVHLDNVLDVTTVNDTGNWILRSDGADDIFGTVDDDLVSITLDTTYRVGSNWLEFTITGLMPFEHYEFRVVAGGVTDPFGQALDGNSDATGGDDYVQEFTLGAPSIFWREVEPIGGISYVYDHTASIASPATAIEYDTQLLTGQVIAASATPVDASATLTLRLLKAGVPVATVTAPGAGVRVALPPTLVAADDNYVVEVTSDAPTDVAFETRLNVAQEAETTGGGDNGTTLTAEDLETVSFSLGTSADRMAVLGRTDTVSGIYSASLSHQGDVFFPNVLNYDFTAVPTPTGPGSLTILAVADLAAPNEFFAVEAEGMNLGEIFVTGGSSTVFIEAVVPLTFAQIQTLTADGTVSVTLTPSAAVDALAFNLAGVILDFEIDGGSSDFYSFSLAAGESATLALSALGDETISLQLYDPLSVVAATGDRSATNVDRIISQFVAPTSGTYFARVSGVTDADYSLVVVRGAAFDSEANDALPPGAQDISQIHTALGVVGTGASPIVTESEPNDDGLLGGSLLDLAFADDLSGSFTAIGGNDYEAIVIGDISAGGNADFDFFRIFASPGDSLTVQMDGLSLTDPVARLYDNTGSQIKSDDDSGSGLGALFTYNTFAYAGEFFIVADSYSSNTGSYGITATLTTTSPQSGPSDDDYYTVTLGASDTVNLSTSTPVDGAFAPLNDLDPAIELFDPSGAPVASNDNGAPDGRNAVLSHVATTAGTYTIRVSSSASVGTYVLDADVQPNAPPRVVDVLVRSTNPGPTLGSGYSLPVGSGVQLQSLTWTSIDQIQLVFDEDVVVAQSDLTLAGVNVPAYAFLPSGGGGFSYDAGTFTATWTLASPIVTDKLLIHLSAQVQDAAGAALDGEWDNPVDFADLSSDVYPSGDGAAGGDFSFRLNVLPADANSNGEVNIGDFTLWADNFDLPLDPVVARLDFNDNGSVNIDDFTIWADAFSDALPLGEPVLPSPNSPAPAGGGGGGGNVEAVLAEFGDDFDSPTISASNAKATVAFGFSTTAGRQVRIERPPFAKRVELHANLRRLERTNVGPLDQALNRRDRERVVDTLFANHVDLRRNSLTHSDLSEASEDIWDEVLLGLIGSRHSGRA